VPVATIVLWLVAGLALGASTTWLARGYALRRQLIDQPGERRSHQTATPRGGGIAMVLVTLLGLVVLAAHAPGFATQCLLGGAGLVLVAGIGWVDDHRPLSALLRLCVHALAATALCIALWLAGAGAGDLAIAFLAAVVLTNVWNFMDGIDGIAASQAAVAACAYALFAGQGPVLWLGLALAAGACGFLPFNFPRARIFMGDVGSGALGYALAALFAMSSLHADATTTILLLFPLTAFLLDASLTLLSRIVRGERWWEAHAQHAYQAWARRRGHVRVTLCYAAAAVVASAALFVMRSWSPALIMLSYMTCLSLGGIAWKRLRERPMDSCTDSLGDGKP
jgi:UDP-N-acetylmuramyl pentapeptide phosphotransferase/UDP-N-acetylglucosamine-1-phosphate transferase